MAKPRLLIIQPTHYRNGGNGSGPPLYKTHSWNLVGLTLPLPCSAHATALGIQLVDEQIEDVPFDADFDVVAITT